MKNPGILLATAPSTSSISPSISQPARRFGRRRLWRSIGVVLAGFVATAVLSSAVDGVLHATGVFPAWGQPMSGALFALAVAYRTVLCIGGCALAARLAADRPMQHALGLGGFGLVLTTLSSIATWNRGPAFGPHWYPLVLIALALPCAWLGGKLGGAWVRARA